MHCMISKSNYSRGKFNILRPKHAHTFMGANSMRQIQRFFIMLYNLNFTINTNNLSLFINSAVLTFNAFIISFWLHCIFIIAILDLILPPTWFVLYSQVQQH